MTKYFEIECDLCGITKKEDYDFARTDEDDNYIPRGWYTNGDGYFWSTVLNICPKCSKELKRRIKPIYKQFRKELKNRKEKIE